jgi:hypothetical protein
MTKVTLTKPWAGNSAGTELEVDDSRAAALDKDGYLDQLAKLPVKPAPIPEAKGESK